jgi:uncharacterized protein (DUF2252 family)
MKYGRMAASPFAFLRGSAGLMAGDLASLPSTGIFTQLCGDAHIDNFGVYATPERKLVFDLNDFDETSSGPWEWDLKRLAASAVVAGRELGLSDAACRTIIIDAVGIYARITRDFSKMATLGAWYYDVDVERIQRVFEGSTRKASSSFRSMLTRVRTKSQAQSLNRLTTVAEGQRRLRVAPPYVAPLTDLAEGAAVPSEAEIEQGIARAWGSYLSSLAVERQTLLQRFRITDAATRIGGIGSVGTRCMIALLEGTGSDDVIILQQKEAGSSVLEPYVGKSGFKSGAERVVHGQRLMQASSDIFLGWHRGSMTDGWYYWRRLGDMQGEVETSDLGRNGFALYVAVCAGCLARAHGRAGDPALASGYIGRSGAVPEAIAAFALAYADQVERDHQALVKAIASGKVAAQKGV